MNEKMKLYLEIQELEKQLKTKREELSKICDHKQFNGQDAYVIDPQIGVDTTKTCSICGNKEWA